jgi:hypothetical protein
VEVRAVKDVIFLVPGFLGFDHFGGFPYFADGVTVALRVALEEQLLSRGASPSFAIWPVDTLPAGRLADRQTSLVQNVCGILGTRQVPPDARIHFIGHSTGALDAELLVRTNHACDPRWVSEAAAVRARTRTVVGLAPAAYGSGIAASALGCALATDPALASRLGQALALLRASIANSNVRRVLRDVLPLVLGDGLTGELLGNALFDPHPVLRFLKQFAGDRGLLLDLAPQRTRTIIRAAGPWWQPTQGGAPALHRFLTISVPPASTQQTLPAERLYRDLYRSCEEGVPSMDADYQWAFAQLSSAWSGLRVIGDPSVPRPSLTPLASDSIVNTALQIPIERPEVPAAIQQIAAVVVADHLDVVGAFPRDGGDGSLAHGFLNSGSHFRGPEFSELYRAIADKLVPQMIP